ncbi:MAG: alpha/beta hydrolase [Spirochaetaceae bacterium]|nr:alpha/beta hydrolase [Spirochaetaceae bacterium]
MKIDKGCLLNNNLLWLSGFCKILLVIIIILILIPAVCFVCNRIRLKLEKHLLEQPIGEYVEVDGHKMCIYKEGEGIQTLLFLSGSGTPAPILDFKGLYSLLSDDYRIVVIEKFGYGFSDIVDTERSFDTILRQDREALAKAGIEGPFILCPHSMSGLEAIMWAQDYPEEVEAIIGLDMVLPRTYDGYDFEKTLKFEKLVVAARKLGLLRFYYSDKALPAALSKDEKALYRAIASRNTVNVDIINEGRAIIDAVRKIDSKQKPDIPMLMFISDGKEIRGINWADNHYKYASALTNASVIELDCGHYVHYFEPELIAAKIREFISTL